MYEKNLLFYLKKRFTLWSISSNSKFVRHNNNYYNSIKGKSSGYLSTNGSACVYQSFDVPYECSRWRDYSLFMPYGQLVVYNDDLISCVVIIRDEHNKDLARKDILNIKYR